jgi:hypothetical protein
MDYLSTRIKEIEQSIIVSLLGDYSEANESAKNELQISKSYVSKEDRLRWLSMSLTRARERSDFKLLSLKYGSESVGVDIFYGSDFFLESQEELYDLINKSPNPIERHRTLNRLAQSSNRFNPNKALKESIMYKLLPYSTDKDYASAQTAGQIDINVHELQTRFTFWISQFEAAYGDIAQFWKSMDNEDSEKLVLINNLLNQLISTSNTLKDVTSEKNRTPQSV